MSQRYNGITKRSKPNENQLGVLKVYAFCQIIQQRASRPGGGATGVMYLSMTMCPKSCRISLKVPATLLGGSKKDAVGA